MSENASNVELARERLDLKRAEKDILEGAQRVEHQLELIDRLAEHGHDTRQALLLLENFEDTLDAWRQHRELIMQRIAVLERAHHS